MLATGMITADPRAVSQEEKNAKIAEACGQTSRLLAASHLPNYFGDLNAMHEAEKVITDEQWLIWRTHFANFRQASHATAIQRAEVFGKVLNLW